MSTTGLRHFPMHIDGQAVEGDGVFEIVNPATEEVVATAARGSARHADLAVAAAKAAHERADWRSRTPDERADVLDRICARLGEQMDELVSLEIAENGVTVRQAVAFHIGYAISHLQYFADLCRRYAFEEPGPQLVYPTLGAGIVRHEPIGVCAGIVPWNFPLLLAVWKLGPALAAGNTIVLKPDQKTPLTLLELARVAAECGLPPGALNVVTGSGAEVGARLARHPDVRKVAFTGSTAVGREVMRMAADNVKRVTLELGGKGPNVVLDDADLETAIDASLFACFLYSGQACESGTRLLLPESLHDDFIDGMVERTRRMTVGDPTDYGTDMGPVISRAQRDRIVGYVAEASRQGAKVTLGGGVPQGDEYERGFWVAPTIVTDVHNDMQIAREEVFGPVISVLKYRTVDEAVAIANDTEYGLSAGVWSTDNERALDVAARLEAGTVWVNDWHMVSCQYPFGGHKQSGLGRELGPRALDEYTEPKFVHVDLSGRRDRRVYDITVPLES